MRLLSLAFVLVLLADAEPAGAQPFIRVRDFVAGEIAAGDSVLQDGSRYDTYRFRARPGEVYYLYLFAEFEGWLDVGSRPGPGCGGACVRAEDDGEAGSTVAMQFIPERPGTYVIRAGGMRGEAGGYQLTMESQEVHESVADSLWPGADTLGLPVDSLPDPAIYAGTDTVVATTPVTADTMRGFASVTVLADSAQEAAVPIMAGERRVGELTIWDRQHVEDYAYFDLWSYQGPAGETVTLRMSSDDLYTELRVGWYPYGLWEEIGSDDDSGDGPSSELTVTFPADGEYHVLAKTLFAADKGRYTLSAERR
jgi:hypothetical protein